jgi:fluoroquinolone transport system permease protein
VKRVLTILAGEARNMLREPELSFLLAVPFIIGLLLRLGLPPVGLLLMERMSFDLDEHLAFLMGYMMLVPPLLAGMVVGLRLVDDRDSGVLSYAAVTPVGRGIYLGVRLLFPVFLSIPLSAMLPYIEGRVLLPPGPLLAIAAAGSPGAPLLALFLGAFGGNKVEAMALAKVSGLLFMAPLAGYLLHHPAVYAAGILPPFWLPLAVDRLADGRSWLLYVLLNLAVYSVWIGLFWRIFNRRNRP